jgi:hypothetical protein
MKFDFFFSKHFLELNKGIIEVFFLISVLVVEILIFKSLEFIMKWANLFLDNRNSTFLILKKLFILRKRYKVDDWSVEVEGCSLESVMEFLELFQTEIFDSFS